MQTVLFQAKEQPLISHEPKNDEHRAKSKETNLEKLPSKSPSRKVAPVPSPAKKPKTTSKEPASTSVSGPPRKPDVTYVPWVEKYRPSTMKQLVGQQGDKSCMKKLANWLRDWPKWHITGEKQKRKWWNVQKL
jgi:replication factor C subunit 1